MLENPILVQIWVFKAKLGHNFILEVSAQLDVRHCPKLQYCAISRKSNDENMRKWVPKFFFMSFTSNSSYTLFQAIILYNLKEN